MNASLRDTYAVTLTIYCKTSIDSTYFVGVDTLRVIANGGQAWLSVNSGGGLDVWGDAVIAGDNFVLYDDFYVDGNATIGGANVNVAGNGWLYVDGDATFNATFASYNGNSVYVTVNGNMLVGGGTAGQQQFNGGYLYVRGNFTQATGSVNNTFVTTANHAAYFVGEGPQTITLANPSSSPFTMIRMSNSSLAGITLGSDLSVALTSGSTTPEIYLQSGKFTIPATRAVTVNGSVYMLGGSVLTVNGALTVSGTCTGRVSQGATINGTGTINGSASLSTACP
jgi:hypothetical protein